MCFCGWDVWNAARGEQPEKHLTCHNRAFHEACQRKQSWNDVRSWTNYWQPLPTKGGESKWCRTIENHSNFLLCCNKMSLPLWIRWSFTPGQGQIFRVMLRKKWQERHKTQSPNKTRSWSQEQNFQNRWLRVVVDFMKLQMMKYIYRLSERQRSTFVMLSFTEGSLRASLLSAGTIFHQTHVRVMIISWEGEP